jgi:hypothetical protein
MLLGLRSSSSRERVVGRLRRPFIKSASLPNAAPPNGLQAAPRLGLCCISVVLYSNIKTGKSGTGSLPFVTGRDLVVCPAGACVLLIGGKYVQPVNHSFGTGPAGPRSSPFSADPATAAVGEAP